MDFVVAPTSQYKFCFVSDVEVSVKHPLQAYLRIRLASDTAADFSIGLTCSIQAFAELALLPACAPALAK
jgi:hypothetical protein